MRVVRNLTVMESSDYDGSFELTTNWRISGGSLVGFIAFDSSFSSAAGGLDGSDEISAANSAAGSPLILLPPSPNCEPCEISITFAQKHELRQVYVRSTARVYETYIAKCPKQSNEYLCTVRCGVATRAEEVLQAPVMEATALVNPEEPSNDSERKMIKDNGSGGASEDDWVEVKASDASMCATPQVRTQDWYEATAEINDSEPCISITIRFLSLQDKGSVFIDEVYIFADPADPTESEQESSRAGNLASNSLMSLFMPTLLQLSRANDLNRERDKQTPTESEKKSEDTVRNSNDVAKIVKGIQQEANLSKPDDQKVNLPTTTERADPETSQHVSRAEMNHASSCNHTDIILHQLVDRVSRIEDFLSRFEDQLLKPIKSIDTRLQQVEQKLEELGKKSKEFERSAGPEEVLYPVFLGSNTGSSHDIELDRRIENQLLASCSRIVAPEFSCGDADLDFSYTNKSENYDVVVLKHGDDDIATANSSENMVGVPCDNHSLPGTEVISAEFEISDEKEGGHSLKESSEEKTKRLLSVNDALASALAGFVSSTYTADKKYSQALIVTAPEFSIEDNSESEKKALDDTHAEKSQVTSDCLVLVNEDPTLVSPTILLNEPEMTVSVDGNNSEMFNGVAKNCNHFEAGDSVLGEGAAAEKKSDCYLEETEKEAKNQDSTIDIVAAEPENPSLSTGGLSSGHIIPTGDEREPKINDVLQGILGFQRTSSSLDFGTPVLDVKFNSDQISENKSFFEALFDDLPRSATESITAVDCIEESVYGPPTDTLSSLGLDYCETSCMHLIFEGEAPPDPHRSSDEENTAASLI